MGTPHISSSRSSSQKLSLVLHCLHRAPNEPGNSRSRSTAPEGGPKASQRPASQHAGKRKANELASSGDSIEPANRRPAPGARSEPLPAISSVTGELAAVGSRQLGPPEGGVTYAAVLAMPVAPFQPSGSLKPTAMDSDLSEPTVSSETANRRTSSNISGLLIDKPNGTTPNAQVTTPAYQQENVLIRRPFLLSC